MQMAQITTSLTRTILGMNAVQANPVSPNIPSINESELPILTSDAGIPEGLCQSGIILNGGFETGDFTGWTVDGFNNPPLVTTAFPHMETFSALAGNLSGPEPFGDSSFYQEFTVPASGGMLSFYHSDFTTDTIQFDWQDAYITDSNGTILQTIFHHCNDTLAWINQLVDMTPYAGQTVRIKFLAHQDGSGNNTGMRVDDVILFIPSVTPTPTPTVTPTATPTGTPTTTPTPTPSVTLAPKSSSTPRPRPTPAPRPRP
jgi:hypothetical protein